MRRLMIGQCVSRRLTILLVLVFSSQAWAGPTPVITAISTQGTAPFAVHVHCLNSTFTVGDRMSSLLEWDFGDPNGQYNQLTGFNAAHMYNDPGVYTLKLSITDQSGAKVSTTIPVTVIADTRSTIYVSAAGNDSNNGTSPSTPIKTMAKAQTLVTNNRNILLRRDDTFNLSSQFQINVTNFRLADYGTGGRPLLNWTGGGPYQAIITLGEQAQDVVIEQLRFDTPNSPPNPSSARGVHPNGTNITVRSCRFQKVSDAMNSASVVTGWLAQNNTADVISGYFIWDQGTDHTFLGNVTTDSINEHTIRLGDCNRVLIANNDLTNTSKSNVWCMIGTDAYLANNKIRSGRILVGPNFASGSPSERFKRAVIEANEVFDEGVILYSGAEHIAIRNNVIHSNPIEAISIWGYYAPMNRTVDDAKVCNNTATNDHTLYGRFLKVGAGATNIVSINNLYCAPSLNTGYGASNVTSDDSSLGADSFHHNLWATPNPGVPVHFLSSGGLTTSQWENLSQCYNEMYRAFSDSDLDGNFAPQFNAAIGLPIAGIFKDYAGNYRPASGPWTVGAVELNPGDPGGPPPPPPTGPIVFNMESTTGWTVQNDPSLVDGAWEDGIPAGDGTRGDPTEDYDGSGKCWLTHNGPGNTDVDGGPTTLVSPTINMSFGNPTVQYARWFYNHDITDEDRLNVQISNNNGSTWTLVESVADQPGWQLHSFIVSDFVAPTAQMKLRFVVSDNPNDSVTEAAIDDLRICSGDCAPTQTADVNGDGVVNTNDVLDIINHWGACPAPCPEDIDGDGTVNTGDLLLVINLWS